MDAEGQPPTQPTQGKSYAAADDDDGEIAETIHDSRSGR
jgi:hypothetical protein